ncbi:hypothetical protein [Pelagibaculum spongiae]|uniref:FCP1 homology domain-containing protein n=1 Tax=Pelagibaculum spongiae TaxID=2080658 RepID=A0A2V1H2I1_9GAMM|nr:hypothetical protein [Pelagibaculum spongiae]PVZ70601.1 hypothetical protein DC094_08460 [Pelagibaculum spongiae]
MNFFFFDLDETLVVHTGRIEKLSPIQKENLNTEVSFSIENLTFHPLYLQNHIVFFQHMLFNKDLFNIVIITNSTYVPELARAMLNYFFKTTLFSENYSHSGQDPINLVHWISKRNWHEHNSKSKINEIIYYCNATFGSKWPINSLTLIDDNNSNLVDAFKNKIKAVHSASNTYVDFLKSANGLVYNQLIQKIPNQKAD